eukprot:COSAG06_NODE_2097_length_7603_cov_5.875933_3_plen_94_part_00
MDLSRQARDKQTDKFSKQRHIYSPCVRFVLCCFVLFCFVLFCFVCPGEYWFNQSDRSLIYVANESTPPTGSVFEHALLYLLLLNESRLCDFYC